MANSTDSTATDPARYPYLYPYPVGRPSPLTLPAVMVGVVLVAMSISGTAVALRSIGRDLNTSGSPLNWVVAGYNLAFAVMTLIAGSTADRIGRRRVFVVSALVFAAGFLGTVLSPAIVVTDMARVVSGVGGAGILAAGGAILASSYDGAARNRAFALMGTMAGVGIATGPTLSGLLISATGWRGELRGLHRRRPAGRFGRDPCLRVPRAWCRADRLGGQRPVRRDTGTADVCAPGGARARLVAPGRSVRRVRRPGRADHLRHRSTAHVAEVFVDLPTDRAPAHKDWQRVSRRWKKQLEERRRVIESLERELTGCGCLSMKACLLLNPDDTLRDRGLGPVRLQQPGAAA